MHIFLEVHMKRQITLLLATAALAIAMSGTAVAQGKHGGGNPTGLDHAEVTANPHGQRGIEKAETKQAAHKDQDKDKDKDNDKGKAKAKGKHKKHKHSR